MFRSSSRGIAIGQRTRHPHDARPDPLAVPVAHVLSIACFALSALGAAVADAAVVHGSSSFAKDARGRHGYFRSRKMRDTTADRDETHGHDPWLVLKTRSRHENIVETSLRQKRIDAYLPRRNVLRQWKGKRRVVALPLFPGYVFVQMVMADTAKVPYDAGTFGSQTTPQMARQLRRAVWFRQSLVRRSPTRPACSTAPTPVFRCRSVPSEGPAWAVARAHCRHGRASQLQSQLRGNSAAIQASFLWRLGASGPPWSHLYDRCFQAHACPLHRACLDGRRIPAMTGTARASR